MDKDMMRARELLRTGGHTCAFVKDELVITRDERGVKPLMELLSEKDRLKDSAAADKVVGKAAAFLYVLLSPRTVYADVISEAALEVLVRFGIEISYGELVAEIRNRTNTGRCPMEQAVINESTPEGALEILKNALNRGI